MAIRTLSAPHMHMGSQGSMRDELEVSSKHHDVEKVARKQELRSLLDCTNSDELLVFGRIPSMNTSPSTKQQKGRKAGGAKKTLVLPNKTVCKNRPHSHRGNSPPHSPRGTSSLTPGGACTACKGLTHQLQSLIHTLVELSSSSVKWMAQRKGIGEEDRHHFCEMVLSYIQPCASLDPSLEYLRAEIKHTLGGNSDSTALLMNKATGSTRKLQLVQSNLEDADLSKAGMRIQAQFRGQQARREVAAMRAARAQAAAVGMERPVDEIAQQKSERALEEAAKTVKIGAVYISRPPGKDQKHQSAEVHKSFESWAVVSMVPAGSRVIVAGPARNCGGVIMMPIEFNGELIGVVDLSLFEEVRDISLSDNQEIRGHHQSNLQKGHGATKKPNFFARFLPKCTRKAAVAD